MVYSDVLGCEVEPYLAMLKLIHGYTKMAHDSDKHLTVTIPIGYAGLMDYEKLVPVHHAIQKQLSSGNIAIGNLTWDRRGRYLFTVSKY